MRERFRIHQTILNREQKAAGLGAVGEESHGVCVQFPAKCMRNEN